jgi:hypothetical protein
VVIGARSKELNTSHLLINLEIGSVRRNQDANGKFLKPYQSSSRLELQISAVHIIIK